jgi:hypothetical protein
MKNYKGTREVEAMYDMPLRESVITIGSRSGIRVPTSKILKLF